MTARKRSRLFFVMSAICCAALAMSACQTVPAVQPTATATGAPAASPERPTVAKLCSNCHTPQAGSLRGNFDSVAYKTSSIQIKLDGSAEVLRFDPSTLIVRNVKAVNPAEPLRSIPKGKEVRVEYTEKDGKRFATVVVSKPPITVPDEKLLKTDEVEKLTALGPETGKYTLIDARPPVKFMEGSIPTAINIPFVSFDKMVDKLPREKDALIIYFCQGCT
jgi:hypothetical protein